VVPPTFLQSLHPPRLPIPKSKALQEDHVTRYHLASRKWRPRSSPIRLCTTPLQRDSGRNSVRVQPFARYCSTVERRPFRRRDCHQPRNLQRSPDSLLEQIPSARFPTGKVQHTRYQRCVYTRLEFESWWLSVVASDPAQNPYWKRDVRRAFPRLSVVTQPELSAFLLQTPENPACVSLPNSPSLIPVLTQTIPLKPNPWTGFKGCRYFHHHRFRTPRRCSADPSYFDHCFPRQVLHRVQPPSEAPHIVPPLDSG